MRTTQHQLGNVQFARILARMRPSATTRLAT